MHSRSREIPSETKYPRIYQTDRKTCLIVIRIFAFVFGFFLLVTIADVTGMVKDPPPLSLSLLANGFFLLLLAAAFYQRDRKVILYEDAIEVKGWFSTRKLRRGEILGLRMVTRGYPARVSRYVITPTDGNAKQLVLPPFLDVDELFRSWMKS
jgi:hypothetical protein